MVVLFIVIGIVDYSGLVGPECRGSATVEVDCVFKPQDTANSCKLRDAHSVGVAGESPIHDGHVDHPVSIPAHEGPWMTHRKEGCIWESRDLAILHEDRAGGQALLVIEPVVFSQGAVIREYLELVPAPVFNRKDSVGALQLSGRSLPDHFPVD